MAGWNALLRWPQLGVTRGLPVPGSISILQFMNRIGGAVPGPGAAVMPGPPSGQVPYMKRIGGAIPGQGAAMMGSALMRRAMGGAVKVPGPMSGLVPYLNRLDEGAVTGSAEDRGGSLLQQAWFKTKQSQATLPTTPAEAVATGAETTPTSPATIGRGLTMKPRRGSLPMLGY